MTVFIIYAAIAAGCCARFYREGCSPLMAVAGAVYWPVLALIALIVRLP